MYEDLFYNTCVRLSKLMLPDTYRKLRFKTPLRLLDSTPIHLCREMFDWAQYRTNKGAVKLHLALGGETRRISSPPCPPRHADEGPESCFHGSRSALGLLDGSVEWQAQRGGIFFRLRQEDAEVRP